MFLHIPLVRGLPDWSNKHQLAPPLRGPWAFWGEIPIDMDRSQFYAHLIVLFLCLEVWGRGAGKWLTRNVKMPSVEGIRYVYVPCQVSGNLWDRASNGRRGGYLTNPNSLAEWKRDKYLLIYYKCVSATVCV